MKKRMRITFISILILINILGCSNNKENKITNNIESLSKNEINKNEIYEEEMIDQEQIDHEELIDEVEKEAIVSNVNLMAVGDIMFHSPQFRAAYNDETKRYDFSSVFKYVEKYIKKADIALANFETVTAGKDIKFSGYPRFNTPKESLLAIKEAGFDIISTANNHSLDYGKKGLIKTIEAIEEYGLKNIGTYKQADQDILIEEINGIKLGFLSYTYGLNGMDGTLTEEELSYMVNLIDDDKIKSDIISLNEKNVDLIVVYIHWGNEYHRQASEYQIELGEKMIRWGADIILGSHPHVIQKSDIINRDGQDKFIVYSMGNFLSNQRYETIENSYTEDGLIVSLNIEKNFDANQTIIKEIEYIPTWVHKYSLDGNVFYEILPVLDVLEGKIEIRDKNLKVRLEKSYKDTMDQMHEM